MPARDLPARPNLEQYKKQAKELLTARKAGAAEAMRRIREFSRPAAKVSLADAQFVIRP